VSRRRPPWSSLGIDPTGDEREIKRAYAKKLKEIDVEAEPAKFIALRKQFEQAQSEARWIGRDEAEDWGDDEDWDNEDGDDEADEAAETEAGVSGPMDADLWALGDVGGVAFTAPVVPLPERANPWGQVRDRVAAHFADIEAALRSADAGREGAIDRATRDLWAEPALETVDAAEDVEQRLAHIALNHGAAAAYLLRLASWHYGWARRAQQVGTGWPISEAGRRATAENWFQRIESGSTGYAKTLLKDLEAPPTGNWARDWRRKRRVREFLDAMRQLYPEGAYRFDPDIVDAWEEARDIRIPWGALIAGFLVALAMAGRARQAPLADPMFWGWWAGVAGGLLLLEGLLARRAARRRRRPGSARLDALELTAFFVLLTIPAIALMAPATAWTTAGLIVGALLLAHESGAEPEPGERGGFWRGLAAARYPLIAALLLATFALSEAPAGRVDWRQAVVPAMLAMLATHWVRPRLVETWEAAPRWVLAGARGALLVAAAGLLWIALGALPDRPVAWAVAAGLFILLAQDAAADAWRPPLSTQWLIAYVVLVAGLAIMPLPFALALVVRRLADRLFIKA
jgi:hypothetical protein